MSFLLVIFGFAVSLLLIGLVDNRTCKILGVVIWIICCFAMFHVQIPA
jgi:hypothetical protein